MLAKGLELTLDVWILRQVCNDNREHVKSAWVGLLLGADFSKNDDNSFESLSLLTQDVLWSLKKGLSEELVLDLGLFHVVSQRQETKPVWHKGVGFSALLLELENFTESSNSIVFSMVVLGLLALLLLDGCVHWELNCLFDALEALDLLAHEVLSSVLGNHSDTVH